MESPSKINDWLHEIAPIGREALESPIDFPVETPPPPPASTGVEVVSFFVPPPSPATTYSELQSPGSDAAIDESRPEKNVTISRHHLVPGKDDHRNAIYMKSKFMEFVEGIMMREFPFELWPDVCMFGAHLYQKQLLTTLPTLLRMPSPIRTTRP
jgi:hypothetical protein